MTIIPPHRATLEKAATAFGIAPAQLLELYDEEPSALPQPPAHA